MAASSEQQADNRAVQKAQQAKNTKPASQNPPADVSSSVRRNPDHGKR